MNTIICRYGELALKGKNRHLFEARLVHNIKDCIIKNNLKAKVHKVRGRIYLETSDQDAINHIKNIFGLVSISSAVSTENNIDQIKEAVLEYIESLPNKDQIKTFRITTNRTNKQFHKKSNEMNIILGDAVNKKYGFGVKLKDSDLNIGVEIHQNTFIYHDKIPCHGGLPLGISGNVIAIVRNVNDLLAAWLFMKRGCKIIPVTFKDEDISILQKYAYGANVVPTTIKTIEEIDEFAAKNNCRAVVVGDVLGDFDPEDYNSITSQILTPLIIYDKQDIDNLLEKIS